MAIELTGPGNCAECGTEISLAMLEEGDAGPVVLAVNGQLVDIPGLSQCTNCAGEILVGEREQNVTAEKAKDFLADVFAPRLANSLTYAYNRFQDVARIVHQLDPHMELALGLAELEDQGD